MGNSPVLEQRHSECEQQHSELSAHLRVLAIVALPILRKQRFQVALNSPMFRFMHQATMFINSLGSTILTPTKKPHPQIPLLQSALTLLVLAFPDWQILEGAPLNMLLRSQVRVLLAASPLQRLSSAVSTHRLKVQRFMRFIVF